MWKTLVFVGETENVEIPYFPFFPAQFRILGFPNFRLKFRIFRLFRFSFWLAHFCTWGCQSDFSWWGWLLWQHSWRASGESDGLGVSIGTPEMRGEFQSWVQTKVLNPNCKGPKLAMRENGCLSYLTQPPPRRDRGRLRKPPQMCDALAVLGRAVTWQSATDGTPQLLRQMSHNLKRQPCIWTR